MQNKLAVKHLDYLDGLRAIAACYVVMHHATMQVPMGDSVIRPLRIFFSLFQFGHYAVTIFIILSGFCLMLPVSRYGELRGGAIHFFKKRAHRILPPYFLAMALSLLLIMFFIGEKTGSHWDVSLPVTLRTVIFHIFLLQDLFVEEASKINHTFWSISVEWRIYLLFPAIIVLWRKWGALPALTLLILLSYIGQFLLRFTPFSTLPFGVCLHYIGLFGVGMLACEVAFSNRDEIASLKKLPWRKIAIPAFLISVVAVRKLQSISSFYIADLFVAIWFFCILVILSEQKSSWLTRLLSWPPLVFVGTFAYSIYLIHAPVLQLVTQYVVKPLYLNNLLSVLINFALGTILSLVAAYVFFLFCERPFVRRKLALPTPTTEVIEQRG